MANQSTCGIWEEESKNIFSRGQIDDNEKRYIEAIANRSIEETVRSWCRLSALGCGDYLVLFKGRGGVAAESCWRFFRK